MIISHLTILILILNWFSSTKAQLSKQCSVRIQDNVHLIECIRYQTVPDDLKFVNISSKISLKLIALKNVKALKSKAFVELNLISLAYSNSIGYIFIVVNGKILTKLFSNWSQFSSRCGSFSLSLDGVFSETLKLNFQFQFNSIS